jgi:hypothetical protein
MEAEHARRQRQMVWPEFVSFGEDLARDEVEMVFVEKKSGTCAASTRRGPCVL